MCGITTTNHINIDMTRFIDEVSLYLEKTAQIEASIIVLKID